MTPMDEIRVAVRVLRERASAATPGPWRTVIDDSESRSTVVRRCWSPNHPADDPDQLWQYDDCPDDLVAEAYREDVAKFMALMDPPVALALADLLDSIAGFWWAQPDPNGIPAGPMAVVRAVLGRAEVRS